MPIVTMTQLLADARKGGYVVCYCESWNLESLQAVLEAAEESRSPIIAGFNGEFLLHSLKAHPENLALYAALGLARRDISVPVAFLLNETDDFEQLKRGIELGFTAVMVESETLSLDEYRQLVKAVVRVAHPKQVSVEAQIGQLRDARLGAGAREEVTDPELARTFVEETGVDALGVSIGNVHVMTEGKATIDLEALRRISAAVKIPLVLHGGSGFPPELAREVAALGVAKINFGTVLKQAYLAATAKAMDHYQESRNPHALLGMGGEQDILVAAREGVKVKVKELLSLYGSAGRA
jgi:ketose-bisphosphate aldolase